jgi:hypothetical protein
MTARHASPNNRRCPEVVRRNPIEGERGAATPPPRSRPVRRCGWPGARTDLMASTSREALRNPRPS